jgi:hypothetical protein
MTSLASEGFTPEDATKGGHDKNVKRHGEKAGYDVKLPGKSKGSGLGLGLGLGLVLR